MYWNVFICTYLRIDTQKLLAYIVYTLGVYKYRYIHKHTYAVHINIDVDIDTGIYVSTYVRYVFIYFVHMELCRCFNVYSHIASCFIL